MATQGDARGPAPRTPKWAYVPVGLIAASILGLGYMAHLAVDDPSFAVEKDYYKKAVAWDETRAQAERNARLGWKVDLEVVHRGSELELKVLPRDARGARLDGAAVEVEAFANARAGHIVSAHLTPQGPDGLAAVVPFVHAGVWEFRFVVESGGQTFTQVLRREIPAGDAS